MTEPEVTFVEGSVPGLFGTEDHLFGKCSDISLIKRNIEKNEAVPIKNLFKIIDCFTEDSYFYGHDVSLSWNKYYFDYAKKQLGDFSLLKGKEGILFFKSNSSDLCFLLVPYEHGGLEKQAERLQKRYSNLTDTKYNIRYYCGECSTQLQTSKMMYMVPQVPVTKSTSLLVDIHGPCREHPNAGFYILGVNERY